VLAINAVVLGIAGLIALVVNAARHDWGEVTFMIVLLAAMGVIIRAFLLYLPWKLVLDGEQLWWQSALLHGSVPVSAVREVEQLNVSGTVVLHFDGGTAGLIVSRAELDRLADALQRLNVGIVVTSGFTPLPLVGFRYDRRRPPR